VARMKAVTTTSVDIRRENTNSVRITVHSDGNRRVFTVPTEPLLETADATPSGTSAQRGR
jgi:hypothetical protein